MGAAGDWNRPGTAPRAWAAGILIGALVFYERGERPVPQAEMQGEMIDNPIIGGLDILPPE